MPGTIVAAGRVQMLRMGENLLGTSVEELLHGVHNLDDAYETAHDLESSETNTIFRFFLAEFSQDQRVIAVLMQDSTSTWSGSRPDSPPGMRRERCGPVPSAAYVTECHMG